MKTLSVILICTFISAMTLSVMGDDPKPPPRYTCECKNGAIPVTLYGMCLCGKCVKIDTPVEQYSRKCKSEDQLDFALNLAKYCKTDDNKEDCTYFREVKAKKSGETIIDVYKSCKDDYDSISDDCENEKECCFVLDDPNAPADD